MVEHQAPQVALDNLSRSSPTVVSVMVLFDAVLLNATKGEKTVTTL